MARALPWHGRGPGFESPYLHHYAYVYRDSQLLLLAIFISSLAYNACARTLSMI